MQKKIRGKMSPGKTRDRRKGLITSIKLDFKRTKKILLFSFKEIIFVRVAQ
jgi:hypothetical protein